MEQIIHSNNTQLYILSLKLANVKEFALVKG